MHNNEAGGGNFYNPDLLNLDPQDGYLAEYFQSIVDNTFSGELREWFKRFKTKSNSLNPLKWTCNEVVRNSYTSREVGLLQMKGIRKDFEDV